MIKVGKSVIRRTPRRAEAVGDNPSRSFGPNRYSRRAHRLGGEKRTRRREEAGKSGEEATEGGARQSGEREDVVRDETRTGR